jgi:hypothetical protein
MRRWLASTSPAALLGWDGQFDLGAFEYGWDDYRGADGHE